MQTHVAWPHRAAGSSWPGSEREGATITVRVGWGYRAAAREFLAIAAAYGMRDQAANAAKTPLWWTSCCGMGLWVRLSALPAVC